MTKAAATRTQISVGTGGRRVEVAAGGVTPRTVPPLSGGSDHAPTDVPRREVGEGERGRHRPGEGEQELVAERVREAPEDGGEQALVVGQHVPGVEAREAPQVDPDRGEPERGDRHDPAGEGAET